MNPRHPHHPLYLANSKHNYGIDISKCIYKKIKLYWQVGTVNLFSKNIV